MKKILILGTGAPQLDLIEKCKERGFEVHACSYRFGDIAEQFADFFALIDITEIAKVEKYVKENKIDYVYSVGSDIAMPTAFSVSKKLGLPCFCTPKTAFICNHKSLLRDFLGNDFNGNLVHQRITSLDEPIKVDFPFIMKPTDSQGQRGVFVVHNKKEYEQYFEKSLSFSREKAIILEENILGDEISVNTFLQDGKIIFLLVSDRITWKNFPGGIIHKHIIPSKYEYKKEIFSKIEELVITSLNKLNIANGPSYFQIIINSKGLPKLIELSPRLDGCHMWRLIKYATGIDLLALTIDGLMGNFISDLSGYKVTPVETEFLCLPSGEKFRKKGFCNLKPYEYLQWYYSEGDLIHKVNGYMEKCGYVIRKNN